METATHPRFTRKRPWKSRLSRRLMFDAAPPPGRVRLLLAPDGAPAFRAVFLPGGSHSVFVPAADALVRAAKGPICNAAFGSTPAVCLLCPITSAGETVPSPRAAVKDGAALAAGTGLHNNGHAVTQAVLSALPSSQRWG